MNLLGGGDGCPSPSRIGALQARVEGALPGGDPRLPDRDARPIDRVIDLGEWKTAWDHITFEGFLGVRMKMQFIWEGCDSALAAPLVLDLARLGTLALERGDAGVVPELAFFFKDPAGTNEHALDRQYDTLQRWVRQTGARLTRREHRDVPVVLEATALTLSVNAFVKHLTRRTRPEDHFCEEEKLVVPCRADTQLSFYSGHTSAAFVAAVAGGTWPTSIASSTGNGSGPLA